MAPPVFTEHIGACRGGNFAAEGFAKGRCADAISISDLYFEARNFACQQMVNKGFSSVKANGILDNPQTEDALKKQMGDYCKLLDSLEARCDHQAACGMAIGISSGAAEATGKIIAKANVSR